MLPHTNFTPIPCGTVGKSKVYELPAVLDIEVSSYYNADGEKRATMYLWQMCVFGDCYYGRTYGDLLSFFGALKAAYCSNGEKIICYVHNLSYDSHFILPWLSVDKMFATDTHEPLYFHAEGFLIFKCSLRLSGKKLATLSENFKDKSIHKQAGYDYKKMRTWQTELTPDELRYGEYDVLVVYHFILSEIERNGDITKIPLTKTGYVRRLCREACKKGWADGVKYQKWFEECTPTDPVIYGALRAAFTGGITHANRLYTGLTLDNITNYDLQSDYPSQTVKNYYPCTPFISAPVPSLDYLNDTHTAALMVVRFYGLKARYYHSILSISKCRAYCPTRSHQKILGCWRCPLRDSCSDCITIDNGRIVQAGEIVTTLTEIDYLNIKDFYTFDRIEIIKMWIAQKDYLPTCFIRPVLELYKSKTTLKGTGNDVEYRLSKEMLNSTYGMCVTNILHDIIEYTPEGAEMWSKETPEDVGAELEEYRDGRNNFLLYQTGVYITAYARRDLLTCIKKICDRADDSLNDMPFDDVVYYDTDSIKMLHGEKYVDIFAEFNTGVLRDMQAAAKHHNLKFDFFEPTDSKGRKQLLGKFDRENDYRQFKTLGAKRYCYTEDNVFKITLAGVNKSEGKRHILRMAKLFDISPFDIFDDDMFIPKGSAGKQIVTYVDTGFTEIVRDYQGHETMCIEKAFIHMEDGEYNLSITDDYKALFNKNLNWGL